LFAPDLLAMSLSLTAVKTNRKVETKALFLFFNAAVNCSFIFSRNDMNSKNINLL